MVGVGLKRQFAAAVTGFPNNAVTWSVANRGSGNPEVGTITETGLYTAPRTLPGQNPVSVYATASDGRTTGHAYVLILSAGPNVTSAAPDPIPIGAHNITVTGTGFLEGAEIFAGSVQLTTTFVSQTTLTAGLYQRPAKSVRIRVKNPGSLFSNTITVPVGNSGSSITVSPRTATVALGATQQFTASGRSSVTWSATAGTISQNGMFTAPKVMPLSNIVTIRAAGTGDESGTATVTLVNAPPPPITITPPTVTVALGATKQFTANGQSNVTWSATAGTISQTGLFTAPATMPLSNTVTITAAGTGNQSGTATVTLANAPPPSITVTPPTATVALGATKQFTASGQSNVTWSASAGTISQNGLFTAPNVMPPSNVTITAAGTGNQSGTATVTLANPPPPSITVTPPTATVALGATQQFTASGQSNVTWLATAGTISQTGLFAAPNTMSTSNIVTITATGTGNQSGTATVTLTNGNQLVTSAAAHRFLQQAGFGGSPADIAHLQAIGFQAWLTEQLHMAPISNYSAITSSQGGLPAWFLANAVTNPDVLRQRVAFALSQIAVISIAKEIWNGNVIPYEQMLLNDAFVNYSQILQDLTLQPCMGYYLDMANNAAANPQTGTVANENYAREVMQLFSIGTVMLNLDGTPQLDGKGNRIPTYDQTNVTELARVFTGWTFAPQNGPPVWGINVDGLTNMAVPMVAVPAYHDSGSKNLLNGYVAPAGLTPLEDLQGALANIFSHPNVGPFISKQLIQHLVKSNPSPAYVARVASAFNNNGQGVHGDMQAVITAILLDPEARANDQGGSDQPSDGHLQEPALYLAGIVRALGGQMNSQNYFTYDLANMGQDIYDPASVFNYYSPSYVVPGTTDKGGEFQIFNTYTSLYRANLISGVFSNYSNPVQTYGPGMTVDLTPYVALANNPTALVNAFDSALTGGVLPAALKQAVVAAVQADAGSTPLHQVQTALYLLVTSDYYNVWH
jgi:uncharacterized protein (DUF1800 family)